MITILLIIIVCILLFGSQKTGEGLKSIGILGIGAFLLIFMIALMFS